MSCLSDQTSTKDYKQTDHSMNKQCPLQNTEARHSLIPDELWIALHLQNISLQFLTLKYNLSVLCSPLYWQSETKVKRFRSINSRHNRHHYNLGPPCPTRGNWHSMLLLMLLMRWAEGLLLPGTSTVMAHCNPKCQRSQTCRSKKQQDSRADAVQILALL